jgi:predicted enzyme related to lactoylglutathione lyase
MDEALARVRQNGGKVVADKHAVPGVGWLPYCQDPEGTVFGMMEDDPKAGMSGN